MMRNRPPKIASVSHQPRALLAALGAPEAIGVPRYLLNWTGLGKVHHPPGVEEAQAHATFQAKAYFGGHFWPSWDLAFSQLLWRKIPDASGWS